MSKLTILILSLVLSACAAPGVIGVAYNQDGIVRYVFPGSNADKADIRVDDVLLNKNELRGKVGTSLIVRFMRDTQLYEVNVMRQHIDTLKTEESAGEW